MPADTLRQTGGVSPAFPALEILFLPPRRSRLDVGLVPGRRISLAEERQVGVVLGSAPGSFLRLEADSVEARHSLIQFRHGRWWARNLSEESGTLVNGVAVHDAELRHRDVITLPGDIILRFVEREPASQSDEVMEAAIASAPDDSGRWAIFADWLQERGDSLGERVLTPRTARRMPDDARWVGPWAHTYLRGDLDVQWSNGLARALTFRRLQLEDPLPPLVSMLEATLEAEEFRFVQRVELDVLAHAGNFSFPAMTRMLEVFQAPKLPLLQSIRIGPVPDAAAFAFALDRDLRDIAERHPKFTTTSESLFFEGTRAALVVLKVPDGAPFRVAPGKRLPLTSRAANRLSTSGSKSLLAPNERSPDVVELVFEEELGQWRVEDVAEFRGRSASGGAPFSPMVNDVRCSPAQLRSNDIIEASPGFFLRFELM
jgi:uncharacterized protein (TIGR02996 family)